MCISKNGEISIDGFLFLMILSVRGVLLFLLWYTCFFLIFSGVSQTLFSSNKSVLIFSCFLARTIDLMPGPDLEAKNNLHVKSLVVLIENTSVCFMLDCPSLHASCAIKAIKGPSIKDVTQFWRFAFPSPLPHTKMNILLTTSLIVSQKLQPPSASLCDVI